MSLTAIRTRSPGLARSKRTAAVEVDDLGEGTVDPGFKAEPDAGAGEIVAVEVFRHLNPLAEPEGLLGIGCFGLRDGPGGIVERRIFCVGQIAGVIAPCARGQVGKVFHARDDTALGVGQLLLDVEALLKELRVESGTTNKRERGNP
jgi:hypothetical protein